MYPDYPKLQCGNPIFQAISSKNPYIPSQLHPALAPAMVSPLLDLRHERPIAPWRDGGHAPRAAAPRGAAHAVQVVRHVQREVVHHHVVYLGTPGAHLGTVEPMEFGGPPSVKIQLIGTSWV